ncbi:uncharacterized protein LOC128676069 [Plodia interpunctella]|uniref:uncharacterized protein LOC128676069 n=1 Tax=Plodia interpunctella TaxID=58824 RepID=UPI002368B899|nr:uncharacterized protein LOC128676069 [Plodia interpunctella]
MVVSTHATRFLNINVIPPFWRAQPKLWFAQFEAVVSSYKTSEDQKYNLAVAVLERTDIEQVSDIICNPPSTGKYLALKKRLLSVYEESESKQFQKLLGGLELGEQKPSQLLRVMRDLSGTKVADDALKVLWMGHLPSQVRAVLSVSTESSLDTMATMADKMMEHTEQAVAEATVGKLEVTSTVAGVGVTKGSNRLCIRELNTKERFLVDTGADISVLAAKNRNQTPSNTYKLYAANNTPIRTYGEKTINLNIGLRRTYKWTFIVADVQTSILGADFLRSHKLLVDLHQKKLIDSVTDLKIEVIETTSNQPTVYIIDQNHIYQDIFKKYPEVLRPMSLKEPAKHSVTHHIETAGPPLFARPRPLPPDKYKAAKIEFEKMMEMDEDKAKTAIITPFGLFEFNCMTFGLRNSSQTFQRFMHEVLRGLDDIVYSFIDDLLVFSNNPGDHRRHVELVLERLSKYGVSLNIEKCEFGRNKIEFLGYQVSVEGITPTEERTHAISNYPKPNTVQDFRRFLGMVNFYRDCLPHQAEHQHELNKYLHNAKKNDKTPIVWTTEAETAFDICRQSVLEATTLSHPVPGAPLSLLTDASDCSLGAVLQQKENEVWKPLAFFSKSMSETQRRYSVYDRELLAMYTAVKHLRRLIEGSEVTIYTDHKPLVNALTRPPSNSDTPRRERQLHYIIII